MCMEEEGGRLRTVEIFIQIHETTVDYCSKIKTKNSSFKLYDKYINAETKG